MRPRGSTTPKRRQTLNGLIACRDRYGDPFGAAPASRKTEGKPAFGNLGIVNRVMFVALNSPPFRYSPRPGEGPADIESVVNRVVIFSVRGLGFQGEIAP